MNDTESALRIELRDPEYSEGYAESFLNSFIATQIKVIREQRGLTQLELADVVGTTQAGISRIENVNYSSWSVRTLIKLARAFGLRLKVSFEPYGSLPEEVTRFTRSDLERVKREEDPGLWQFESDRESRIIDMGWWKATQEEPSKTQELPKKEPKKSAPWEGQEQSAEQGGTGYAASCS